MKTPFPSNLMKIAEALLEKSRAKEAPGVLFSDSDFLDGVECLAIEVPSYTDPSDATYQQIVNVFKEMEQILGAQAAELNPKQEKALRFVAIHTGKAVSAAERPYHILMKALENISTAPAGTNWADKFSDEDIKALQTDIPLIPNEDFESFVVNHKFSPSSHHAYGTLMELTSAYRCSYRMQKDERFAPVFQAMVARGLHTDFTTSPYDDADLHAKELLNIGQVTPEALEVVSKASKISADEGRFPKSIVGSFAKDKTFLDILPAEDRDTSLKILTKAYTNPIVIDRYLAAVICTNTPSGIMKNTGLTIDESLAVIAQHNEFGHFAAFINKGSEKHLDAAVQKIMQSDLGEVYAVSKVDRMAALRHVYPELKKKPGALDDSTPSM